MTRTSDDSAGTPAPARRRSTWRERLFVLGGFAVAALWTAASLALGTGAEAIGPLWMAAVLWTVPSSLACALSRGLRHRDWSAFGRHEFPDDGELFDWSTRTGRYTYLRHRDEHILRDDRRLR